MTSKSKDTREVWRQGKAWDFEGSEPHLGLLNMRQRDEAKGLRTDVSLSGKGLPLDSADSRGHCAG